MSLLDVLVFDTWTQLVLVAAVLLVAQLVYVVLGFGSGLIAVGALAMILPDLHDAVVLLLLVNLPAELWVVCSSWRRVQWAGVSLILVGVGGGIPVGTAVLAMAQPTIVLAVLGGFLVCAGLLFSCLPAGHPRRLPALIAPAVGLVSGILTGLFGTGGPPLILYYRWANVDKATFRGCLMAIFLIMTVVRVPSYLVAGLVSVERLYSGLVMLPVTIVGVALGNRIHLELSEQTFRRLVCGVLVLIGVLLLV